MQNILRHVAENKQILLEELYQACAWPLFKKFGHAYDAYKQAITYSYSYICSAYLINRDDKVFEGFSISPPILDELIKTIRRRLTPQPVKIRADIEVTCFHYEGIDSIKAALKAGEECSTEQAPIQVSPILSHTCLHEQIKLLAPPTFVMFTTSLEKNLGITALNTAIEKIKEEITKRKGELVLRVPVWLFF